jgi:hypothetical protein
MKKLSFAMWEKKMEESLVDGSQVSNRDKTERDVTTSPSE